MDRENDGRKIEGWPDRTVEMAARREKVSGDAVPPVHVGGREAWRDLTFVVSIGTFGNPSQAWKTAQRAQQVLRTAGIDVRWAGRLGMEDEGIIALMEDGCGPLVEYTNVKGRVK